jgi:hypothetical protein
MNTGRTVFAQLMEYLPLREFQKCVQRYDGEHKVKTFTCLDQFYTMAFAQLTYRESLRDIEACLRAFQPRLYHMGFRGRVSRNTLSNANSQRDWRIFQDFVHHLIQSARLLYVDDDFGVDLDQTAYALDATTVDLCLSLFPWARFEKNKARIKIHTLLELNSNLPVFIHVSKASWHEIYLLDQLVLDPGCFYIFDRGYLDYERLYRFTLGSAFFVTRTKTNTKFQRRYSRPVDKSTGLCFDQTIFMKGAYSPKDYPAPLRRVGFIDLQTHKKLTFLTNNFDLPALTIAQLYKSRWKIELFFKWLKQHLRIKAFYGVSVNAVKTQIWIAISVYVLVALLKKRLGLTLSLYTILQILSVSLFEKTPILEAFLKYQYTFQTPDPHKQLSLFT